MSEEKKKGIIRRHPIITGVIAAMTTLIVIIVAVVALIGSAANQAVKPNQVGNQPGTSAPAKPGQAQQQQVPTLAVGKSVPIKYGGTEAATITITKVETSTTAGDQYGEAPKNGEFVTATVVVKVLPTFTQGFDASSFDFYAVVDGTHYDEGSGNTLFGAPGVDSELQTTTLNAGESASGTLLFDVTSTHGKIAYSPNFEGGPLAYWKY